jgi:hypothetical protein
MTIMTTTYTKEEGDDKDNDGEVYVDGAARRQLQQWSIAQEDWGVSAFQRYGSGVIRQSLKVCMRAVAIPSRVDGTFSDKDRGPTLNESKVKNPTLK